MREPRELKPRPTMHDSTGSKNKPTERKAEIQPASPEEREQATDERRDAPKSSKRQ